MPSIVGAMRHLDSRTSVPAYGHLRIPALRAGAESREAGQQRGEESKEKSDENRPATAKRRDG